MQKLRHIDLDVLWRQEQKPRKRIPLDKVLGTDNIADFMTKNLTAAVTERYVSMMNLHFVEGRSAIAQKLHALSVPVGRGIADERPSSLHFPTGSQSLRELITEIFGAALVIMEFGGVNTSSPEDRFSLP